MEQTLYELSSVDVSNVGIMGVGVSLNWRHLFDSQEAAKAYAEADYGHAIHWKETRKGLTSGDLLSVMYDITPAAVKK